MPDCQGAVLDCYDTTIYRFNSLSRGKLGKTQKTCLRLTKNVSKVLGYGLAEAVQVVLSFIIPSDSLYSHGIYAQPMGSFRLFSYYTYTGNHGTAL